MRPLSTLTFMRQLLDDLLEIDRPRFLDGQADDGEVEFARKVLVPGVALVALTAVGIGAAKACCGVRYRRFDPYGMLPIGMALLTASVAAWSYLNPQPMQSLRR